MQNAIIDKYTAKIMDAVKAGNKQEADTYKLIKAKMMEFITKPKAPELTQVEELSILSKMKKEREESAKIYTAAGRNELAEKELAEVKIIDQFVPTPASEAEITKCVEDYISTNGAITQKDMGIVIKHIKSSLTNVDGALASKIVREHINK